MTRPLYEVTAWYQMFFGGWTADLPFHLSLAHHYQQGGPILECGVGTGRVAIALARAGHRVHGVDVDVSMLRALSERLAHESDDVRARITHQHADVRSMTLGRTFPLIIAPFNGIAHQHDAHAIGEFLRSVRAHLSPGGLFAFDTWIPDPALLAGRSVDSPRFRDPRDGSVVRCTETHRYDESTRLLTMELAITSLDDGDAGSPEVLSLSLRQIFPEEMTPLLEDAGFEVLFRTSRFSPYAPGAKGFDEESEDERGEMLAWVCRQR